MTEKKFVGNFVPVNHNIGIRIIAVIVIRRHKKTNGSAFAILYFAAMNPVLQSITNNKGAVRTKN
jgi:hypothetical protein